MLLSHFIESTGLAILVNQYGLLIFQVAYQVLALFQITLVPVPVLHHAHIQKMLLWLVVSSNFILHSFTILTYSIF